jgi:putative transposase
MARPLRIHYEGAFYHVMARGNEKRAIFHTRDDREKFLDILRLASERFGIIVHGYCLMLNHYHILIETPRANISKAMHFINSFYVAYYRPAHMYNGHLFQGRFKSILVQKDEYLNELSRYIHLNPVRAGLVSRPEGYEWSSYRYFMSRENHDARPAFLEARQTLNLFAPGEDLSYAAYTRFVCEGITKKLENPLKYARGGSILGTEDFCERVIPGSDIRPWGQTSGKIT